MPPTDRQYRVALLIHTSTAWAIEMIEGVNEYARDLNWLIWVEPRGLYEKLLLPHGWSGDGVIARVNHPGMVSQLVRQRMPAVNVSWSSAAPDDIPRVTADEHACGRVAAEHFLSNGLRHFAYCGPAYREDMPEDRMGAAFIQVLKDAGYCCQVFRPTKETKLDKNWFARLQFLSQWIGDQSRPFGLLTWSDTYAREIIEASRMIALQIPEDMALITAEHNALMSHLSNLSISSLNLSPRKIGYEAAHLLGQLMRGDPNAELQVRIPPMGIVQRQSTDLIAIDDPILSRALQFIRENAHRPIQVRDVVHDVQMSRRSLELHFDSQLGRSPADEIRRVRLERSKHLLIDTDLPIVRIAEKCGFNDAQVLIRNFKRTLKITPDQFRKQAQPWRDRRALKSQR